MKILMLLETAFPPDDRVEKEIRTLMQEGHEVILACSTRKDDPSREFYKGFSVARLSLNKFWYKASVLVLIFPLYLRRWKRFVKRIYLKEGFDAIHVHDLPLTAIGRYFKNRYNLKFIADQHEYYSDWIVETAHYNTFLGSLVKFFSNWKKYESKALNESNLVITVEPPLRENYIHEYSLPPDKIITLPNTPERTVFDISLIDPEKYKNQVGNFTLLYVGGLDILRGIDYVIRAIPEIIQSIPGFKFLLAGRLYGGYDPMQTAAQLNVEDHVEFLGWIELSDLPSLISVCDIGVFTPPSHRDEINKTIATKNYQFLVMGKPMIVGKAKYMKEFTVENGIGWSIDEENPGEISKLVIDIYKDQEMMQKAVANCREISENYFWEKTSRTLTEGYESLKE